MRTPEELVFRARQELGNLRLSLWQPAIRLECSRIAGLPDPSAVIEYLQGKPLSSEITRLADCVLLHKFPIPGGILETGERVQWRCDYRNGVVSNTRYFRFVPYLDFARVGDHKVIWDLNRHQHLVVLAQAFRFTGNDAYLIEIRRQVLSWQEDNPVMRGINWTSALEVAFRALSWLWVYHLVGDFLDAGFKYSLLAGIHRHGQYLERNLSIYFAPNTHLIGEAVALHALGSLLPDLPRADRWRATGADVVSDQMDSQIRDDGSHFEQSAYYHLYALDMFMFHQTLAETSSEFRSKLWRMADFLDALMGSARTLPQIGDDDGGRFFHPYGSPDRFARATLATCARFFDESKWAHEEADLYEQALWWLGLGALRSASGARDSSRPSTSRLFAASGLAVLTSSRMQVIVDGGGLGADGGGHSHSDSLSLIVRDRVEEILVDSGTYTYVSDVQARNWFRGSAAHNTVRVDGRDQAVAVTAFSWVGKPDVEVANWQPAADCDFLDIVCRYRHPASLVHRRRVALLKNPVAGIDVLVVNDRIEGVPGLHVIEQFWHPGEALVSLSADHVRIGTRSHLLAPAGTELHAEEQWRSRSFGERARATALVVKTEAALPVTLWAVVTVGEMQPVCLTPVRDSEDAAVLQVSTGETINVRFGRLGEPGVRAQIQPRE